MILLIDNYDSFVFTVARYLAELDEVPRVIRNDAIDVSGILELGPAAIVLSPGPCAPEDAGNCLAFVRELSGRIPILGICLGHQCIGEAFGGLVRRAQEPLHGRATPILHDGSGVFQGVPSPFNAGRYHSLAVELPASAAEAIPLLITARSEREEIMGLAHFTEPTYGVQFHPESILTQHGHTLLANFLKIANDWQDSIAE
ncbi:aminodeoxychorismate/anthranilate synthase component II [Bradyrhizobium sp. CCGUVB1N3]|uniref:anthranilate synthase component II n=1 Tax=Bradyrhizobium sp. CCGUVB1N3 TaxID=2949629 RepID=UPI0020B3F1EC|nr:aminodeoxychorismate/anthranilate synthase component II [Bradyrhizobium sp. CCGUVB1N3]MCP3472391.1 aminodeoxychorismate/anthranilate synthase component II [Bradyrhizobium sp. CCGUVB1N3]